MRRVACPPHRSDVEKNEGILEVKTQFGVYHQNFHSKACNWADPLHFFRSQVWCLILLAWQDPGEEDV